MAICLAAAGQSDHKVKHLEGSREDKDDDDGQRRAQLREGNIPLVPHNAVPSLLYPDFLF